MVRGRERFSQEGGSAWGLWTRRNRTRACDAEMPAFFSNVTAVCRRQRKLNRKDFTSCGPDFSILFTLARHL